MKGAKKKFIVTVLICLGSTTLTTTLMALMTDWTYSPSPLIVGQTQHCSAELNGAPLVASFQWEYRCIESGCAGGWVVGPSKSQAASFVCDKIGKQEVKCTAYYVPFPPTAPTSITHAVDVKAPDNYVVTKGDQTPFPNGPERLEFNYKLRYGTTDLLSIAGLAQEKVVVPATGWESDWMPGVGDPNYYLAGNTIIDKQLCNLHPADWNALPINTVLATVVIHHRVVLADCCGQSKFINLGSRTFTRRKVNATDWQTEITP